MTTTEPWTRARSRMEGLTGSVIAGRPAPTTKPARLSGIRVRVCQQFLRDYRSAGVGLQRLAETKIQDLQRRAGSDPTEWRRAYGRVEGLKGQEAVLEVDLAGGPRLLAVDYGTNLLLWRMGEHDITKQAHLGQIPRLDDSLDVPALFTPAARLRFFPEDEDQALSVYGPELRKEWMYWLDPQQQGVGDTINDRITDAVLGDRGEVELVVGGPGTGKTTLLLWLLKGLSTVERGGAQLDVRFLAPVSVVNQLENATGWDLAGLDVRIWNDSEASPDVILMDDPESLADITEMAARFPDSSIVVGFDPLQMSASISDDEFARWVSGANARVSWLTVSYRQKEVVGRAAKRVADMVATSSPFLADNKKTKYTAERLEITRRSNDLTFANPAGMIKTVEDPSIADWEEYWRAMYQLRRTGQLWNYWTPLLTVSDPKAAIPHAWLVRLDPVPSLRISTDELPRVKGLEFQHGLLLLSQSTYSTLQSGFVGSGRRSYDLIRLFRIPFSRSKDSLVTFVFPNVQ